MKKQCCSGNSICLSCKVLLILILVNFAFPLCSIAKDYKKQRLRMVDLIENEVKATSNYIGMSNLSSEVMESMRSVRRHEFVPKRQKPHAYENRPLAIGHGQTISQPYIVALMTDLLNLTSTSTVLEVGTGSGYQAAILSGLVSKVYTLEIIDPLALQAKKRFKELGYANITSRTGDGYYGWKEHAPFDAIIVTAAASHIPPPLLQQLKPGGRMVIPVGSRFLTQQLLLIEKDNTDKMRTRQILPVRFVPLTGEH